MWKHLSTASAKRSSMLEYASASTLREITVRRRLPGRTKHRYSQRPTRRRSPLAHGGAPSRGLASPHYCHLGGWPGQFSFFLLAGCRWSQSSPAAPLQSKCTLARATRAPRRYRTRLSLSTLKKGPEASGPWCSRRSPRKGPATRRFGTPCAGSGGDGLLLPSGHAFVFGGVIGQV